MIKIMEPRKTERWCFSDTTSTPSIGNELHMWIPDERVGARASGRTTSSDAIMEPRARSSHETPSVASPRQRVVVTDCDSNHSYRFHADSQCVKVFQQRPHVDMSRIVTTTPKSRLQKDLKPGEPIGQQGTSRQYSVEVRAGLGSCTEESSLTPSIDTSRFPAVPVPSVPVRQVLTCQLHRLIVKR